jgi:hypothetical protein
MMFVAFMSRVVVVVALRPYSARRRTLASCGVDETGRHFCGVWFSSILAPSPPIEAPKLIFLGLFAKSEKNKNGGKPR